jgi:quercetin dioxygenase-like cupin family protein
MEAVARTTREREMQIIRSSIRTRIGEPGWFTGHVYIDTVATPGGGSRLSAVAVHFAPGARSAWHTHPNGQTLFILEGVCLCQRRGGPIEILRPATGSSSSQTKTTGMAPLLTAS